jgi:hypothetical protein
MLLEFEVQYTPPLTDRAYGQHLHGVKEFLIEGVKDACRIRPYTGNAQQYRRRPVTSPLESSSISLDQLLCRWAPGDAEFPRILQSGASPSRHMSNGSF